MSRQLAAVAWSGVMGYLLVALCVYERPLGVYVLREVCDCFGLIVAGGQVPQAVSHQRQHSAVETEV